MDFKQLVKIASNARENSYSPYSKYKVGAAVLTDNDKVYTGVNVENASFGATNCAERTAIFKAVTDGERKIKAIAISIDRKEYGHPCGLCRQVLAEFADDHMKVICANKENEFEVLNFGDLMPYAFRKI